MYLIFVYYNSQKVGKLMIKKFMNKKVRVSILLALFIGAQCWVNYLVFNYPAIGIGVEQNRDSQWIVTYFEIDEYSSLLGIQIGDEIKEVDGSDVNQHESVIKWSSIAQARSVLVHRDGEEFEVSLNELPSLTQFDVIAYSAQIVCFTAAFLLYRRLSYSLSARYLTIAILTGGFTFMTLGASIREDTFGKIFIVLFLVLVSYTLLHFLIVFFQDRGGIVLQPLFLLLKYGYIAIFITWITTGIFYAHPALTHYIYPESTQFFVLIFLLGILLNVGLLTYLYFKHRASKSFVSTLVRTVWISLLLSMSPIAIFSFAPLLIYGEFWIDAIYTAWFIMIFPLSFTYFITSERLYDIDMIIRRLGLTTVLSIVPAGIFTGMVWVAFQTEATLGSILLLFIFTLILLSLLLYSLEFFITKLEPVLFPRKYDLQSSLEKIATKLSSTSNFNDLKTNVLVDIVSTLEVFGCAIVFKYRNSVETITEGAIDLAEVESLIALERMEHRAYTINVISRKEEYTSYLVMTQKKTNTLLGLEDTQWLNLIISYLAVSLENVYLIRKLTLMASHRDLLHRVTMNTINDGVIITDKNGIIVELNQLIEKITNCRKENVINESVFIFEDFTSYMDNVISHGQRFESVECIFYPSPGKQINCLLDAFPILNDEEEIIGAYLRIWDISERIEHEQQMMAAEKFSLMGKLAAGIAHEIRNPLTSIMGLVHLLREKYVNAETYYRYIHIIHDELQSLNKIVTDFVLMAKPSLPSKKEVILQHIIHETVQLMTSQANLHNIILNTDLSPIEVELYLDATQLKQVFMNIIQNAFEASPEGGEVTICLVINPDNKDIEISIQDNGIGMTEIQMVELFIPFFTTKENGIGIGLGICSRIIDNHNGKISVASNLGVGTIFTIVFQGN